MREHAMPQFTVDVTAGRRLDLFGLSFSTELVSTNMLPALDPPASRCTS